jgi:hypothetical protein
MPMHLEPSQMNGAQDTSPTHAAAYSEEFTRQLARNCLEIPTKRQELVQTVVLRSFGNAHARE